MSEEQALTIGCNVLDRLTEQMAISLKFLRDDGGLTVNDAPMTRLREEALAVLSQISGHDIVIGEMDHLFASCNHD